MLPQRGLNLTKKWSTIKMKTFPSIKNTLIACVAMFLPLSLIANGPSSLVDPEKIEDTSGKRMLHTMLRVADLDRSLAFYCDVLGMQLLRQTDYPSGKFTLAFVGYGPEETHTVLELTYNWDQHAYDHGNAFGHIAIAVDAIEKTVQAMKEAGVTVTREPGPMKFGGDTVIAFIQDPDGYMIELIERD